MRTEDNRNSRRDAKRSKRYKPVKTGMPKGFSKSEWFNRHHPVVA